MTIEEVNKLKNGDIIRSIKSGTKYMVKTDILSLPLASIKNMHKDFELVTIKLEDVSEERAK